MSEQRGSIPAIQNTIKWILLQPVLCLSNRQQQDQVARQQQMRQQRPAWEAALPWLWKCLQQLNNQQQRRRWKQVGTLLSC